MAECTWWGAEREPIFEAPLRREDPRTVPVTQEGPFGSLRLLDATKIVHSNQEVLLIVHLERRGEHYGMFVDILESKSV